MPTHPRYTATVLFELWRRGSAHHGKAKIRAHRRRRGTDELEPLKPSSEEQHEEEFYVKVRKSFEYKTFNLSFGILLETFPILS